MAEHDDRLQDYEVKAYAAGEMGEESFAACVAIIEAGDAVDPESAANELPRASVLVVASRYNKIVGVGAIKRIRRDYASRIADRSGVSFGPETPELGYVAVHPDHRGKGLSGRIVEELLSNNKGSLFATTSSDAMKRTLTSTGFVLQGKAWEGQSGQLSLWIREAAPLLPDTWYVLVCGLPVAGDCFDLGSSLILRRLLTPLSIFDLAAVGAVGFRQWAALESFAAGATAEISCPTQSAAMPGYDALNKCWLVSALLVLRGFARHICPACSAYSWNLIAGHQKSSAPIFRRQLADEGAEKAVFEPRASLPDFQGGLLEYHIRLLIPRETRSTPFDLTEATWFSNNFERFHQLASNDERFRFALEAATDWRYAKDPRAALARVWAGVESLLGINSELVYRVSLCAATAIAPRGPDRISAYRKIKGLYGVRSKAVHGEPISEERLFTGLHDSFEVLRALLLDAVERGAVRTDDDFTRELLSDAPALA